MTAPAQAAAAGEPVIVTEELTRTFGRFVAVDHLSFTVQRGEIFGFLGPNGAGKSTTIRMLCGLLRSTSGRASVGGCDINREPERVREKIGYMSQKFSLYKDLTVVENLAFFGGVYGLAGARLRDRAAYAVRMAGLAGLEQQLTGALSGALQQRLALGCAILHEPPILFLDEPTSGVDPISRRMFWDLIQELAARGVTILVTTHFLDEAEFCGRIGLIAGGRLAALDTPAAVRQQAVTEDLFEVDLPKLTGARAAIQRLDGVAAVCVPGRQKTCRRRPKKDTAATLEQAMTRAGWPPERVLPAAARLEDAFIRLVERNGEPAA